jgi:uncharacterized protein
MDWLFLITLVALGTGLRWLLGPLFGALVMGGAVGTGVWFVSGWNGLDLLGLQSIAIGIAAGVIAFIFVLVGLANWIGLVLDIVPHGALGGSRGGRFSGGGGGSGGGGASGRW